MSELKLSILVPVWNGRSYVQNCIKSLMENDYENYEIIVIAGGPDNSFEEGLKYQNLASDKIKVYEQKTPNKNKALNLGLTHSSGDIIVLTDIDCIFNKNWLINVNKIFQKEEINVVTSYALPFPQRKSSLAEYNKIRYGFSLVGRCENSEVIIGNKLCGANSMFRRKVFTEKIGKFDESIRTGEDKILGIEFNKKGESVYYFHHIFVYTEHFSNNLAKYMKHRIRWAKDLFIEFKKKDLFVIVYLFSIGLFKLVYPFVAITFWIIFLNFSIMWLILIISPWFIFYFTWIVGVSIQTFKNSKIVNHQLNTNFNPKKALKIIPLMFFVVGIISVVSFINPFNKKWYH